MSQNEHHSPSLKEAPQSGGFCPIARDRWQADFEVNAFSLPEGDFIVITDLDKGNKSVTNDIDYVIEWLHQQADFSQTLNHAKILYQDSMKR
jgi:hypothetical protein